MRLLGFWAEKCVPGRNGSKIPIKTTRNTWYFGIAPRARTVSQKSGKFAKLTGIHEIRGISQNSQNFAIFAEIPEKRGSGPPPRPQPGLDRDGFQDLGSAPLPGARALGPGATGIRPRADGNPAPSRRKSGPEPTEIRPRADGNPAPTPIPSPPLKILTLLTSRSGRTLCVPHPLTPICQGPMDCVRYVGKLSLSSNPTHGVNSWFANQYCSGSDVLVGRDSSKAPWSAIRSVREGSGSIKMH